MKHIKESAAGGSMGGGSVAVRMDGDQSGDPVKRIEKFMQDFYKRLKNKTNFHPVKVTELKESDNSLNSIVSRLKSAENKSEPEVKKFAIEDEEGNLVKITVPASQAEDVQNDIAQQLSEIEEYKSSGYGGKNMTIAELIFDMRRKYNLVDVVFPDIAPNNVYKSKSPTNENDEGMGNNNPEMDTKEVPDDNDMDDDFKKPEDGELEGGEDEKDDMPPLKDADNVEDLTLDDDEDVKSILNGVLDMMKKTAEAEKAKADAEAEKSRAMQAKYTAMATKSEMAQQEEIISMEAELEAQKEQEKEAQKLADLAKHKYMKSSGIDEGFSFLRKALTEVDEFENVAALRREKNLIRKKYQISPEDTPETKRYKQKQLQLANREVNNKIKQARLRDEYHKDKEDVENDEAQERDQNNQQQENV